MKTRTFVVPTGGVLEIGVSGDYVRVKSSEVELLIENPDNGESIEVGAGDDFEFSTFQRLRISHASGADQTIKLTISKGKRAGSAQIGGAVTVSGPVDINEVLTTVPGHIDYGYSVITVTNASQLLIGGTNRTYLAIQNNSTTGDVWVKAGGAAAIGQCIKIPPGGIWEPATPSHQPLYFIGSMASNPDVVVVTGYFNNGL
jgi:hypothetical protein